MSALLNFTAAGTFGPSSGFRLGSIQLAPGAAAATATILDGNKQVYIAYALANQSGPAYKPIDQDNGVVFSGQPSVGSITAGATLIIEEL